MRREHLETLGPVCPCCRSREGGVENVAGVRLAEAFVEADGDVVQGVLRCSRSACCAEFPIVDGVAVLRRDARTHLQQHHASLHQRDDLDARLEGVLGDVPEPGSAAERTRYYTSIYAWDAYGDLDPGEGQRRRAWEPTPGSWRGVLDAALACAGAVEAPGFVLDAGCGAGRSAFELAARTGRTVAAIDADVSMLRVGARVAREGVASYERRRTGVVYERRTFAADLEGRTDVSFWCADAMDPPFRGGSCGLAVALNLLDCVPDPAGLLAVLAGLLARGGVCALSTPYDWTGGVTPIEGWLGGHSARGDDAGDGASVLRRLVTPGAHPRSVPGVALIGERDGVAWRTRLHERAVLAYAAHVLAFRRVG